jgi:hypothetical protein
VIFLKIRKNLSEVRIQIAVAGGGLMGADGSSGYHRLGR